MYTLELEFQISGPHKDTNQPGHELLRFPPMKIKVEKPVTAKFSVLSATNQGIYLSVIGTKSNGLAGFDDGLQWRVFCENQHCMLYGPDPAHGFKLNLHGPDGKEVPKTDFGQTIGINFDAVKTGGKLISGYANTDASFLVNADAVAAPGKLPPGMVLTDLNFMSGVSDIVPARPLPLIKDCFAMDQPGIYTLELQIQLLRVSYETPVAPGPQELLRFPPITIKMNRP